MRQPFADPYELALRDSLYRDRVAAAYDGENSVLDALWWHLHPLDASPDGTPSPAAVVAGLERAAFTQQGERELTPESMKRLTELRQRLVDERHAITRAVAEAGSRAGSEAEAETLATTGSVPAAIPTGGAGQLTEADGSPPSALPTSSDEGRPQSGRRFAPVVAVGAAALIAGIVAGIGVGQGIGQEIGQGQGAGRADAAAVSSASLEPLPAGYRPSAFTIFDRPQAESDLPPYSLGADVVPESVRSLGLFADAPPPPVATTSTRVFVARDSSGRVCLIFLGEGERQASTCSSDGDFARSGLRLSWRTRTVDAYATVVGAVDQTVFWRESGQVTTELRAAG